MQVYSIKIGEIWLLDPVHFRKKLLDLNSVTHLPFAFPFPFPVNHAAMLYFQIKEFKLTLNHTRASVKESKGYPPPRKIFD